MRRDETRREMHVSEPSMPRNCFQYEIMSFMTVPDVIVMLRHGCSDRSL